jgi:hypothetical protein
MMTRVNWTSHLKKKGDCLVRRPYTHTHHKKPQTNKFDRHILAGLHPLIVCTAPENFRSPEISFFYYKRRLKKEKKKNIAANNDDRWKKAVGELCFFFFLEEKGLRKWKGRPAIPLLCVRESAWKETRKKIYHMWLFDSWPWYLRPVFMYKIRITNKNAFFTWNEDK